MTLLDWIGGVGMAAFALAWIPQSVETMRAGRCGANLTFLCLSALGSGSLTAYAFLRGETVFLIVNGMTTFGALLNVVYKAFQRREAGPPGRGDQTAVSLRRYIRSDAPNA